MAKTKGISFVNAQAFCGEVGGSDGWSRVLAGMDHADQEVLQSLLAVGWYDLWLYARMIRAIDSTLGNGDFELIKKLGRFEAERDISTVYRLFFRLANPGYAIGKTMAYWRRFHDTGVWNVERVSDEAVHGTLSDWGVVDVALCLELTGYMPRVIELVGGKNAVMVHPRCRSKGADTCVFELSWQK